MDFLRRIANAAALAERLEAVERRLTRLEDRLEGAASPTFLPSAPMAPEVRIPVGPVEPPPLPARPRPPRRRAEPTPIPARPGRDLERFVGVAVLGRLGVTALLLAAAYFAQLAYRHLGPLPRVLSIYGLAGLLIGTGFLLRARVAKPYLAILWGGGVAAAYLAGAVARLRYGIVEPLPATLLLLGACALAQALARSLGLSTLAHVALAGAYAAPLLVGGPQDARTMLLVYLLALHAWAALTERRWGWTGARAIAVVGTVAVATTWLATHGRGDLSTLLHAHAYLFGLAAPELLATARGEAWPLRNRWAAALLGLAELGLLFALLARGRSGHLDPEGLIRWPLVAGALWLVPAFVSRLRHGRSTLGLAPWVNLGEALLVVGGLLAWSVGTWPPGPRESVVVATLTGIGLLALLARRWWRAGDAPAVLAAFLALLVSIALPAGHGAALFVLAVPLGLALGGEAPWARALGLALALGAPFAPALGEAFSPWGHAGALALASAIAALVGWHARSRDDASLRGAACAGGIVLAILWAVAAFGRGGFGPALPALWNAATAAGLCVALGLASLALHDPDPRGPGDTMATRLVLGLLLLALGWRETHQAVQAVANLDLRAVLETGYLAAFASLALVVGFLRRLRPLRWGALALFGVVVVKVGFFDLDSLETPYRVLITAVLGVVFLLAAYAYARRDRASDEEGPPDPPSSPPLPRSPGLTVRGARDRS